MRKQKGRRAGQCDVPVFVVLLAGHWIESASCLAGHLFADSVGGEGNATCQWVACMSAAQQPRLQISGGRQLMYRAYLRATLAAAAASVRHCQSIGLHRIPQVTDEVTARGSGRTETSSARPPDTIRARVVRKRIETEPDGSRWSPDVRALENVGQVGLEELGWVRTPRRLWHCSSSRTGTRGTASRRCRKPPRRRRPVHIEAAEGRSSVRQHWEASKDSCRCRGNKLSRFVSARIRAEVRVEARVEYLVVVVEVADVALGGGWRRQGQRWGWRK